MPLTLEGHYYTTTEAAEYCDCSDSKIKLALKNGELEGIAIGHTYLFERKDLDTFKAIPERRGRPIKKASEGKS